MTRITSKFVGVGVGVVAVTALLGGSAAVTAGAAGARSTAGLSAHISAPHAGAAIRGSVPVTDYGAGYFSYPGSTSEGVSGASATFVMPSISCASSSDSEWLLPGIWVYDGGGNLTEQVDVNFNCNGGGLYEQAVICVTGADCDASLTIAPGDAVVASLSESGTATTGSIRDLTSGGTAQVIGSATTSDGVVFVGDDGPALFGVTAVPTFSPAIKFSRVQVNSQYLNAWGPSQYNLKSNKKVQIATGSLTSPGDAFTTTFKHNS
jgi:hypothetical protein